MDPECKIIHQTWKTNEIPAHWQESVNKWKELHPDWQYKLWTDADNLELIKTKYPQYLDMYQGYEYNIQRADFIRYVILKTYGGLYSDLDIVPLRPFTDKTFYGTSSDVYLMKNNNYLDPTLSVGVITNALMISTKKNSPFWQEVIDEAERRYKNPHWLWIGKHRRVINMTGPQMITHVFHHYSYPLTLLPTDVTLCSVCDPAGTTRGKMPQVMSIEGKSWNGLDTSVLNFVFCYRTPILIIILLLIAYFVYRFYRYKKYCNDNNCTA